MSAPVTVTHAPAVGAARSRLEGREKVTGEAVYAFEHPIEGAVYAAPVISQVARGEIRAVDATAALALPGVLAVLSCENAPRLGTVADPDLALFQSPRIAYRGQLVAAVVADSLEVAQEAARLVRVEVAPDPHDVVLRVDHPRLYEPPIVNPRYPGRSEHGDPDAALASAAIVHDATYVTPAYHNNPIEPHAAIAVWDGGELTIYDSTQSPWSVRRAIAEIFELPVEAVRIISPHVGGGFGAKGGARASAVLAAIAARVVGRPVKVAFTRREMYPLTGYRTPMLQRVQLGAQPDGRLVAIVHDVVEQCSTVKEFAEQAAVTTRVMYAAPHRRTTHRLAQLDVPCPTWMRAPGECPGSFALESAIDELATACGLDPIELRIRNEPEVEPETGLPFSSRNLVACLREGAERFGWALRDPAPRARQEGRWLHGSGVACARFPANMLPSQALARAEADGTFAIRIAAADIGTGARTVLAQIAADALDVPLEQVAIEIGDTDLPEAPFAGGSMGTSSWGFAVVQACRRLRDELSRLDGGPPAEGLEVRVDTTAAVAARPAASRAAYGAQFADVRVDVDTGEVRVSRLLGVFAAGRIINPKTARSQLIGGMTMGISMALHEENGIDPVFGDFRHRDLASYQVATCADVEQIDAVWVDEIDYEVNPMGLKGVGEIGIVGTAAAIANAVHHATGIRVRDLPIRPARLLG
jgi:xanthine dehydrogenase YagR molybdenum-binding subunit